jgi:broad specificity phosphatase PhoE
VRRDRGAAVIWIVRHTDTEWSAQLRHTGRTDLPLSAAGREHAGQLRARLAGVDFAAVICSPLRRARETAELAGLTCTSVDEDLVEWDYGDYEGLTTVDVRKHDPGWDMWRDGAPGGEDAAAVGARVDRVLDRLTRSGEAQTGGGRGLGEGGGEVVLVAHAHVLRVLTARWLGLPPVDGALFMLEPGGIGRLGHERERRVLCAWDT